MEKRFAMSGLLALMLAASGCSSSGPVGGPDENPPDFVGGGGSSGGGAATTGLGAGGSIAMTEEERARAEREQLGLNNIIVYFEFDRSDIRSEFNEMLSAHAQFLTTRPGARVRLEGHADETGSREYNIGLGERRAQAVRRILMLQGASASQLTTVSYGEERPAALGSDEESYSLNRRVELVYE